MQAETTGTNHLQSVTIYLAPSPQNRTLLAPVLLLLYPCSRNYSRGSHLLAQLLPSVGKRT